MMPPLIFLQFREVGAHFGDIRVRSISSLAEGSMNLGGSKQRFGIWWLAFGYTLALHVLHEAGHDFLSVITRTRWPFAGGCRFRLFLRSGNGSAVFCAI